MLESVWDLEERKETERESCVKLKLCSLEKFFDRQPLPCFGVAVHRTSLVCLCVQADYEEVRFMRAERYVLVV